MRLSIAAGAFAVIMSSLLGVARADEKQTTLPPDLSWIPPNCTAFAHVRFAELWDGPLGKALRTAFAKSDSKTLAEIERMSGVRLSQIDQVTIVIPDALFKRGGDPLVIRIVTTEPYDAKRVLSNLSIDDREPTSSNDSRKAFRLQRGFVHLTGPKTLTFVISESGAIGLLGKMLEHQSSGPLSPALKLAAQKHQLLAGLNVSSFRSEEPPPAFRPLFDAHLATLVGDIKPETAEFNLRLNFARPGLADEGAKATRGREIRGAQVHNPNHCRAEARQGSRRPREIPGRNCRHDQDRQDRDEGQSGNLDRDG